jgi:putative ABC transport system permease protein
MAQYVYRENAILAAIGIALGLVFGVFLHREVVLTTEVEVCMFGRSIAPASFLYSVLCCSLFAVAANLLMYRRIKRIDMVEAMKSVE